MLQCRLVAYGIFRQFDAHILCKELLANMISVVNLVDLCDTIYPDIHIIKKNIKIRNLIKSILFKLLKPIHMGKKVTFASLLPNKTY